MAFPVVASSTNNTATSTTLTLSKPSGVGVGDLLILLCGSAHATGFNTAPDGWTLINHASTTGKSTAAYWRIADGSEASTTDVTQGSSVAAWGFYLRVTGAHATTPIDAVGADVGSTDWTWSVTQCTTSVAECYVVGVFGTSGYGGINHGWSGTGWTRIGTAGTGFTTGGSWARRELSAAGASGNATCSLTSEDFANGAGFQFAIAPPAGITPSSADLTLTAVDPTVSIALVVAPDAATVTTSAVSPTVVLGSLALTPATADVALVAVDPTVAIHLAITPASADLTLAAVDPTVSITLRISPSPALATFFAVAPTVLVIRPSAELALVAELRVSGAAELALRGELDLLTPTLYRVFARAADGTETELGTLAPGSTTIAGVALADGDYVLRVEADGRFWRGARFRTEYAISIVGGELEVALPPISSLRAQVVGSSIYVTWRVDSLSGTTAPADFAVWVDDESPVATGGAPAATATWAGLGGYLVQLAAAPTTLFVAVRARLGAQVGPLSEVAVSGEAAPGLASPTGFSTRIPDGDWGR